MLLGVEPVEYHPVVIIAVPVTDGRGHQVSGAHTQAEAEQIAQRYAYRYRRPFWAGNIKVEPA